MTPIKYSVFPTVILAALAAAIVSAEVPQVTRIVLVNAATNAELRDLADGSTIDLARDGNELNVRAVTTGPVGSVRFSLDDNTQPHLENVVPYALAGDRDGDYNAWTPTPGKHQLRATAFSQPDARGNRSKPRVVQFTVIGSDQPLARPAGVYREANGLVVMEVENTASPRGQWVPRTTGDNFTGTAFWQFTGNRPTNGPANSPLTYRFRITNPGLYHLHLRSARDASRGQRNDYSNDAYLRVIGDYAAGPDAGDKHGDHAPLAALRQDTKYFCSSPKLAWATGNRLDLGGHTNKRVPVYRFKAGKVYTFVMSGRSQYFSADRIVFRRGDVDPDVAEDLATPESTFIKPPDGDGTISITGERRQWHKVTLDLDGPYADETTTPNPFLDYRLTVTFTHESGAPSYRVPGYFAADGDAANSAATAGTTWRAHLSPDKTGRWNYRISMHAGKHAAVANDGQPLAPFHGKTGSFTITPTDKSGRDFRAHGRLQYVGERYLRFARSGQYFLKQGADAPENLLAYADFDNTPNTGKRRKTWAPHVRDWRASDPTWRNGKGKGLIGAVNYLASEGMNVMSFLTMSAHGDDKNVFPWLTDTDYQRFDVSKCAQWEIVFQHMTNNGIYLHFKTQETENDQHLDGGDLGLNRKLYYRELIARFGHHLALNWNLGEENTNTAQQCIDFAQYFHDHDPYRHNVVLHTYPGQKDKRYNLLIGNRSKLTGLSLQTNQPDFSLVHGEVATWVRKSAAAGKPWVVACDEPGDAQHALRPDADAGQSHVDGRRNGIWGTFLAGGAGNEWYFGYKHAHSDLTCQDFRSRDQWWDYCRHALDFFRDQQIPVHQMMTDNDLTSATDDYCFFKPDGIYLVYLKRGGTTALNLADASGAFSVRWYDPRQGGNLQTGSVTTIQGGATRNLGTAPNHPDQDWLILVRKE